MSDLTGPWENAMQEIADLKVKITKVVQDLQAAENRIQVAAKEHLDQLTAIHKTLSFFKSVILSGEKWTNACQKAYDAACAGEVK